MSDPQLARENESKDLNCFECLGVVGDAVSDYKGNVICQDCVEKYYKNCVACGSFLPEEEVQTLEERALCADCAAKAAVPEGVEAPSEEEVEALIGEYVALYAENKKLGERLEQIKERLKTAAAIRPRVSGAVTLRAGDDAVKCSYKVGWKCDPDKTAALEELLGPDQFARVFERKLSFTVNKDEIEKVMTGAEPVYEQFKKAIGIAVEKTETVSLALVPKKKKK